MSRKGVDDAGVAVRGEQADEGGTDDAPHVLNADDAALVARAEQGEVGAFAALVHRHAAALHAQAGEMDAVRRAFQRAMRRLERADTDDVEGWLAGLLPRAHRRRREAQPAAAGPAAGGQAPPLPAQELDALWAELATRWPRGRRPFRLPRWLRQLALVVLLLVLAVTIPYIVLTTAGSQTPSTPEPVAEVEGVPLDDDTFDLTFEDEPGDEPEDAPEDADNGAPDDPTEDIDPAASDHLDGAP